LRFCIGLFLSSERQNSSFRFACRGVEIGAASARRLCKRR